MADQFETYPPGERQLSEGEDLARGLAMAYLFFANAAVRPVESFLYRGWKANLLAYADLSWELQAREDAAASTAKGVELVGHEFVRDITGLERSYAIEKMVPGRPLHPAMDEAGKRLLEALEAARIAIPPLHPDGTYDIKESE